VIQRGLDMKDLSALRRRRREARRSRVRLAREDPACFAGFVLLDEKSHKPIRMAGIHEAWQYEASAHDRLLIWSHPDAGKTQQLSIARVIWELGRDPSKRVAIVSRTDDIAKNIVRVIGNMIVHSDEVHEVFPQLRRSTLSNAPWNDHVLTVERPNPAMKDPSVQAFGESSRSIVSKRLDMLVVDDILDNQNTASQSQMDDMWEWFNSVIQGRLEPAARVIVVGNAWHPDDFLHRLARLPDWRALRYPVLDDAPASPTYNQPRWPEHWSVERIARRKAELDAARPGEFARMMMCQARDEAQARFKLRSIERCKKLGMGRMFMNAVPGLPREQQPHLTGYIPGYRVVTGVDLAFSKKSSADQTCIFTIAVDPDENRHVLSVETGRWHGDEAVDHIIDVYSRFLSIVYVENNAAQDLLVQNLRGKTAVPVRPFTTGKNKVNMEYGVEAMSIELDNGKWIIPCDRNGRCHPEVEAWIGEMLRYDPAKHTGDRLMASWIAKEAARVGSRSGPRAEYGSIDLLSR
jgi:hypothetical protein